MDVDGEFRHALRRSGWRAGTAIQPARTRQVDLRADEAALWGDLRKKWRQYVNKARNGGIRVVDATDDRLPGVLLDLPGDRPACRIRHSHLRVVPGGLAGIRAARHGPPADGRGSDGAGLATLCPARVGDRVIEPYGGMTAAGAESRANYLLKWEAIRTSTRAGRRQLRHVGPLARGDRALQEPASAVARSTTSAPGTWFSIRWAALAFDGAQVDAGPHRAVEARQ